MDKDLPVGARLISAPDERDEILTARETGQFGTLHARRLRALRTRRPTAVRMHRMGFECPRS